MLAIREYTGVRIRQGNILQEKKKIQTEGELCQEKWEVPEEGEMDCPVGRFRSRVFFREEQKICEKKYTKWLDYDKMKSALTIRTRRAGDYLTIRDAEGQLRHKPLKAYLITEKIPAKEREQIAVIAEDNHILWLTGYRISEYYKVGRNTKRILQVQLRRSREDGEREENNG